MATESYWDMVSRERRKSRLPRVGDVFYWKDDGWTDSRESYLVLEHRKIDGFHWLTCWCLTAGGKAFFSPTADFLAESYILVADAGEDARVVP